MLLVSGGDEVVAIVAGSSGITLGCGGGGMLEILLGACAASTIFGAEGGSEVTRMGTTSLSLLLSPSTWKMVGTALGVVCWSSACDSSSATVSRSGSVAIIIGGGIRATLSSLSSLLRRAWS